MRINASTDDLCRQTEDTHPQIERNQQPELLPESQTELVGGALEIFLQLGLRVIDLLHVLMGHIRTDVLTLVGMELDRHLAVPSSHYYLRSLSRTSGTLLLPRFSGPHRGSREDLPRQRESPREDPLGSGRIP